MHTRIINAVRRLQVKWRLSLALIGIVMPALLTSLALLWALDLSGKRFQTSINSALDELMPITRLELEVQQARLRLDRVRDRAVPAGPSRMDSSISRQFRELEAHVPASLSPDVQQAYQAWQRARPAVHSANRQSPGTALASDGLPRAERELEQASDLLKQTEKQLHRSIMQRYREAERTRRTYERVLFWVWLAGAGVILLLLSLLSASILTPLAALRKTAKALQRGEFGARVPITGNDEFTAVGRVFNNMADTIEHTQRQLHDSAVHDPLTGLLNRRGLDESLQQALQSQQPLSLLLVDVDHFKALNDNFGHQVGDEVLAGLAQHMASAIRADDALGRYGGDEFLAVLPGIGADEASRMAQRLIEEIEQWRIESGYPIGISIGVAETSARPRSAAELIHSADKALYQSKASGRGRLRVFSS